VLVEQAMGKAVPRDVEQGAAGEDSSKFEAEQIEELAGQFEEVPDDAE